MNQIYTERTLYNNTMDSWARCQYLLTSHLNQDVRITVFFFYQAVADFEHGLKSILTDPVKRLEMDESFDEPDVMISWVSLGFLCSVS